MISAAIAQIPVNALQVKLDAALGRAVVLDVILEVSEAASRGNIEFIVGDEVLAGQLPAGIFALTLSYPTQSYVGDLVIRAVMGSEAASLGSGEKFLRVVSVNVNTR